MRYIAAIICILLLIITIGGLVAVYDLVQLQQDNVQQLQAEARLTQARYHELALEIARDKQPRPTVNVALLIVLLLLVGAGAAVRHLQNEQERQRQFYLLTEIVQAQQRLTAVQTMQLTGGYPIAPSQMELITPQPVDQQGQNP